MPPILSGLCAGVVAARSRSVTAVTLKEQTFMYIPITFPSTLKYCGVQSFYIVFSPSLLVKVGVFHASKSDSCQLSLAPAHSCRLFTVRSPDSAAQPATLCVIGEGGSNEPRSAELSRLGVRGHRRRRHTFPSFDRSSLFVKPFFFHLSPQNEPAFLPRTRNRTREEGIRSNPIHFPHRLILPLL